MKNKSVIKNGKFKIEDHHTIDEVIAIFDELDSSRNKSDVKIIGLGPRMSKFDARDKLLIVDKLISSKKDVELIDFPFSLEQLNNYVAFSEFINLPRANDKNPIFQYLPEGGYSVPERNKRAAQKRKQLAEFNDHNKRAREKIAILKANRIKEKRIVEILEEEGIKSHRGSKIVQGSVNRLYHNYLDMVKNFDSYQHEEAGSAGLSLIGSDLKGKRKKTKKKEKYYDEDAMGANEIKVFDGVVNLVFHKSVKIDFDFYLFFIARDGKTVADVLSINKHYVENNMLRINISEQTILSPGRYCIQMCLEPKNNKGTMLDFLICDIERNMIELSEIRFVRNLNDDVVPLLREDSYHVI